MNNPKRRSEMTLNYVKKWSKMTLNYVHFCVRCKASCVPQEKKEKKTNRKIQNKSNTSKHITCYLLFFEYCLPTPIASAR